MESNVHPPAGGGGGGVGASTMGGGTDGVLDYAADDEHVDYPNRGRGGDDADGPPSCLVDLEDDVVVSKASQDPGEGREGPW